MGNMEYVTEEVRNFLANDQDVLQTGAGMCPIIGADITDEVLEHLRAQHPEWNIEHSSIHVGDFLTFSRKQ